MDLTRRDERGRGSATIAPSARMLILSGMTSGWPTGTRLTPDIVAGIAEDVRRAAKTSNYVRHS